MKLSKSVVYVLNILFILGLCSLSYPASDAKADKKQTGPVSMEAKVTPVSMILDKSKLKKIDFPSKEDNPLKAASPEPPTPPVTDGWETIKNETFEGAFPNSLWQINGTGWDDNNYRAHNGSWSGWCADDANPGAHTYINNMTSFMIYGPFDLSNSSIIDAKVTFYHWTITEQSLDYLFIAASINGTSFYGDGLSGNWTDNSGNVNGWMYYDFDLSNVYDLGNLVGQSQVWIAFVFDTDVSVVYEGSYVDDVTISKLTSTPTTSITVTSPNGSEVWDSGSSHNITWTSTGLSSSIDVKIEYTTNNGSSWSLVNATTSNDGTYRWTVPSTTTPLPNCKVRVSGLSGTPTDQSNNTFTINPAPGITVTSPNGGEVLQYGSNHSITWTSFGTSGIVNIDLSIDNGSHWERILSDVTDDGAKSWSVPNTPSTNCKIRITDKNNTSLTDQSDNVFTIQGENITVTSPNGGEIWLVDSSHNITWTHSGTSGTVKIEYSINNGSSWSTIISSTTDDGSHNWTIPNTISTICKVRVSDTDGSVNDQSDNVFTIQGTESITVTSPNGGENWIVNTSHNITWNSSGTIPNVKIEYTSNNGTSWSTIVASTSNDGTHSWTIPNIPPSTNCKVRISDTDGTPTDQSNSVFTISGPTCPPHFTFNVTEDYYPILLHVVTLEGVPTGTCDEVGVFASNGQGGQICAGSVVINGAPPYSLQAWSDDSQTTPKDGFTTGETLHFRFWDSSTQTEYNQYDATFTAGNGAWGNGALAEINPIDFNAGCELTINLVPGWNWISSNVAPEAPAMETVWAGVTGLTIVKGENGFYIPGTINTIGNWDVTDTYIANMQNAGQLVITGTCVAANTPIPLHSGWNWTSYLPDIPINTETALASIVSHLAIAKARNGFYIPGTINTIGNMTTGAGYKFSMSQAATLTYPDLTSVSPQNFTPLAKSSPVAGKHFAGVQPGYDYQALVIEKINVPGLKPGAEIGVFSGNSLCAGSAVYTGSFPMAIMAWADNEETTEIEGIRAGEQMRFRYWDIANNIELELQCTVNQGSTLFGESSFTTLAFEAGEQMPAIYSLQQNYPNPFNPTTTIQYEIPETGRVELAIYNVNGELIKTLVNDNCEAGRYTVIWDGTNSVNSPVSSGVYFYRLDTPNTKIMKKLTFIK